MYIIDMVAKKKIGRDKNYIFFIYKCKKRRNIYIYKKIKILGDIKEGAKVLGFGSSLYF
jgi:hypothetical protein